MHAKESLLVKYLLIISLVMIFMVSGCKQKPELPLSGKKVAILTGEGFHDGETLIPMAYLMNYGAELTILGSDTGKVKAYNSDIEINVTRSVVNVNIDEFDALILPGGYAPEKLREDSAVVSFARDFFKSGKPVAAICHGPQLLITAGLVKGKHATCYKSVAKEMKDAGALYEDKEVVVDGNLVTSRQPSDLPLFLKETMRMLKRTV
jgi:protease I